MALELAEYGCGVSLIDDQKVVEEQGLGKVVSLGVSAW